MASRAAAAYNLLTIKAHNNKIAAIAHTWQGWIESALESSRIVGEDDAYGASSLSRFRRSSRPLFRKYSRFPVAASAYWSIATVLGGTATRGVLTPAVQRLSLSVTLFGVAERHDARCSIAALDPSKELRTRPSKGMTCMCRPHRSR